jgi:hypothetical protein
VLFSHNESRPSPTHDFLYSTTVDCLSVVTLDSCVRRNFLRFTECSESPGDAKKTRDFSIPARCLGIENRKGKERKASSRRGRRLGGFLIEAEMCSAQEMRGKKSLEGGRKGLCATMNRTVTSARKREYHEGRHMVIKPSRFQRELLGSQRSLLAQVARRPLSITRAGIGRWYQERAVDHVGGTPPVVDTSLSFSQ